MGANDRRKEEEEEDDDSRRRRKQQNSHKSHSTYIWYVCFCGNSTPSSAIQTNTAKQERIIFQQCMKFSAVSRCRNTGYPGCFRMEYTISVPVHRSASVAISASVASEFCATKRRREKKKPDKPILSHFVVDEQFVGFSAGDSTKPVNHNHFS